ncbi:hypothetical protein FRB99_008384 [Tulasnella sp. 403]|nr:hypothetical protein FRB99_008384 [Tulasnella sp. 403]
MARPSHARQPSLSLLPPPTQAFLHQIHQNTTIPYTALPAVPTQIVLLQDSRYTFTYLGVTSIGSSPYRHFSLWDGWMEREWSVYALDAATLGEAGKSAGGSAGLRRTGSLSSSSTISNTTERASQWYSGAGVMGSNERRALKNEEVRNALTAAFLQLISRSLPSMDIVI